MAYKYDPSKAEEVRSKLEEQIKDIALNFSENPDSLIEFTKFSNKFYNYSQRNTMLIFQQNPGALFCNSYKRYKDMGYSVKKGEHGMKILVPVNKTFIKVNGEWKSLSVATTEQKQAYKLNQIESKTKLLFKVGTVFDIAQTTCPIQDYPKYFDLGYSSEHHRMLFNSLKKFCENELKYQVKENAYSSVSLRGVCDHTLKEISISGNFDDTTKLSILSHEAGHALMHNTIEARMLPTYQREFEADVVSIRLHDYMGVDISESRKRHLSDAYKTMVTNDGFKAEQLTQSLDRANKAFNKVISSINQDLRPELALAEIGTTELATLQANPVPVLPNQLPDMGGIMFSM